MDGRLCGLRHHSKTSTWRTSDHRFGDTISSWPTELRATRNRFDEIRLCAFLVGSEAPSSPMSWVASKRIGAHPRPGLQERSKGSQDLTAGLFDRRSGPGLPLRRLRPSFCSRKLTKATSPRRGGCRSRLQSRQVSPVRSDIQSAARSPERTAHRRFVLSGERARLRCGRCRAISRVGRQGPSPALRCRRKPQRRVRRRRAALTLAGTQWPRPWLADPRA